jgi:D-arabinose 5-phosphate isomerase GutQ
VAFTAHRTAPLPFADTVVRLPAQAPISPTHLKSFAGSSAEPARLLVHNSVLPMGSAYELALQLLLDTIAVMLQQENNITEELMKSRLSNLE